MLEISNKSAIQIETKKTRVRWFIVFILFIVTAFNFADRSTISIAAPSLQKQLGLNAVSMGYVFSAFAWSYAIAQLPGGWLLDRFGSKKVYAVGLFLWSFFTFLQAFVGIFSAGAAIVVLFILRFLVGASEAPALPANTKLSVAWFPSSERGTATAIWNSAQYFATVLFSPILGWLTSSYGWHVNFAFMGVLGMVLAWIWFKVVHNPKEHPWMNRAEFEYIEQGGALVNVEQSENNKNSHNTFKWVYVKQLLKNRMLMGTYIGQYGITTLTYFFLTWFPVYLVQQRHMSILKAGFVASLPAICGFIGGVLGGMFSDYVLKKGYSLTAARKIPIVVGMLLSMSLIAANYVDKEWIVVAVMAIAFFGKGFGALGWAVVSDTSPKEMAGLSGGLFNTFSNIAGITTPIAIGYIVQGTGSFNGALIFVGAHAFLTILCYVLIVGEIKRFEIKKV